MSDKTEAPWNQTFVERINAMQSSPIFHGYTCGSDGCGRKLVAIDSGMICPSGCGYMQTWAHDPMSPDQLRHAEDSMKSIQEMDLSHPRSNREAVLRDILKKQEEGGTIRVGDKELPASEFKVLSEKTREEINIPEELEKIEDMKRRQDVAASLKKFVVEITDDLGGGMYIVAAENEEHAERIVREKSVCQENAKVAMATVNRILMRSLMGAGVLADFELYLSA
jgi:hypothetical protein